MSTPMFIAAFFTVAKIWKQPKCPSTDEWIKKWWYMYNRVLLSHKKKKNEILPFATAWMDLENTMLSEISQHRKTKIISLHFYIQFKLTNKIKTAS